MDRESIYQQIDFIFQGTDANGRLQVRELDNKNLRKEDTTNRHHKSFMQKIIFSLEMIKNESDKRC